MTVTIRATTAPTAVTNTTFSVNKPTGTLAGDLMLLMVYAANGSIPVPTLPAGWQQVREGGVSDGDGVVVFYKVAGVSEGSSYTLTTTASQSLGLGMISLYGDTPLTIDTAAYQVNSSSTNRTWPSVTASAAGLAVLVGALDQALTSTPPGSATEQWDVTISANKAYLMTAAVAAAGATGTYTATGSAGASDCITIVVVEAAATTYPTPDLRSWSTTSPVSSASSFDTTIPADVEAGDLLILHAALDADRTVTDPSGWTLLQSIAASGGIRVWWRIAEAGDAGDTVTVSFTGGTTTIGSAIAAFVSRGGKTLVVGASAQAVSAGATSVTFPSVAPTRANALLIALAGSPDTTGTEPAAPNDFLERYDFGGTGVRLVMYSEMLTAAGATGTRTANWTSASHVGNVVSLSIEEVSEGILYNGTDLRQWLKTWSLEATVGAADTTVLNSEAKEQVALLCSWVFNCTGIWTVGLDDVFGAAVVSSQHANNSLFVEIDQAVTYESATAYVAQYKPQATIDNVWVFAASIGISGAPTRGVL